MSTVSWQQNIQLATSSYVGSPDSGGILSGGTNVDPSVGGDHSTLSPLSGQDVSNTGNMMSGWGVAECQDNSSSQIINAQNNDNLTFENR